MNDNNHKIFIKKCGINELMLINYTSFTDYPQFPLYTKTDLKFELNVRLYFDQLFRLLKTHI